MPYRTAYARGCYMDPEVHGNSVFNWNYWHHNRAMIPHTPSFAAYDDLNTTGCWASALDQLFGSGEATEYLRYLPNFPGSRTNTKFYFHKISWQVWRITKL